MFDGWISLLLTPERFCFIPSSDFIPDLATALIDRVNVSNTEKLIELTSSARDSWQTSRDLLSVRELGVQILSYLDGTAFLGQDLPAASSDIQVALDIHRTALGLLNVRGPTQKPPSYIEQIAYHLDGLLNSPDSPGRVSPIIRQLLPVLSDAAALLQRLRDDDKKLLAMNNVQLEKATTLSLLDDMTQQASNVYTGNTNSSGGQLKQGVVWIRQQLQSVATINVSIYH